MKNSSVIVAGCIAVIMLAAFVVKAMSPAETKKRQKEATAAVLITTSLRTLGLQGRFISCLPAELAAKWKKELSQLYVNGKSPLITDFFRGAVMMVGPQNNNNGIIGFFDPWSDNVLLLAVNYEKKLIISDYRFLSGTFFRTGKAAPSRLSQTVFPTEMPLEIALLKAVSETKKKFMAVFPVMMKEISLKAVPAAGKDSIAESVLNIAGRFERAMTLISTKDNELLAKMVLCNTLVQKSPIAGFEKMFDSSASTMKMAKAIVSIPANLRKGFKICYYLPTKSASIFSYMNPRDPSLIVMIEVPNDRKKRYRLVLMNLGMADQLLSGLTVNPLKGGRK